MEGKVIAVGIEPIFRKRLNQQIRVLTSQYLLTRKQHGRSWSVTGVRDEAIHQFGELAPGELISGGRADWVGGP